MRLISSSEQFEPNRNLQDRLLFLVYGDETSLRPRSQAGLAVGLTPPQWPSLSPRGARLAVLLRVTVLQCARALCAGCCRHSRERLGKMLALLAVTWPFLGLEKGVSVGMCSASVRERQSPVGEKSQQLPESATRISSANSADTYG